MTDPYERPSKGIFPTRPTVRWEPIETCPLYETVLLYRSPDLYPVVGFHFGDCFCCGCEHWVHGEHGERCKGDHPPCPAGGHWYLQGNGPEDGDQLQMFPMAFAPTHWTVLPIPEAPEAPQ